MGSADFPMIIRPLEIKDVEQIKSLSDTVFPIRYPADYFADCIKSEEYLSLAIFDQLNLLGFIFVIKKYRSPLTPNSSDFEELAQAKEYRPPYISTIGIRPSHQGRGLGAFLISQAKHILFLNDDPKFIYLHVMTANENAIRFYERIGFQKYRKVKNYYQGCSIYPDAYIMIKPFKKRENIDINELKSNKENWI
ncbi:unnamed protein product [Bursaphelenchus xylophilus]|uniref:N-alpha-acetyltransferase 60 n=1 Tax=Bursaphelenchus xylophilus TaxID=6326 RepID=A0A1I7SVL5_BURXY|nr:unnamed protein product [Bursaphelenchus xylophilus]CAG9101627.1 unnamed protein product [Bursaphelenchus xylophilus]